MSKGTKYWRAQLAAKVSHIGGYHVSRGSSYPIEFTVYCNPTLDPTTIRPLLVEHGHFLSAADFELQCPDFDEWFLSEYDDYARQLQDDAVEQCVEDLREWDGLRMWSPEIAKKYGFDYVGEGAEHPFDCTLSNYGRGGKHICLEQFDGVNLEGVTNEAMLETLEAMSARGGVDNYYGATRYSNLWVRQMCGMLDEWTTILTTANAEDTALHYATDRVANDLERRDE